MMFKGFKFGMILQLAVGPVCLFIFQLGGNKGFIEAETGVLSVALIDLLYISLAILGIATFIDEEKVKYILKLVGAIVITFFGLNTIVGTLGWQVIPSLNILKETTSDNSFIKGLILTGSNPLTIMFWAGVFSAQIAEGKLKRKEVYLFGIGSVLATLLFLSVIAIAGTITRYFLPAKLISALNIIVGLALIYFAARMFLNKSH